MGRYGGCDHDYEGGRCKICGGPETLSGFKLGSEADNEHHRATGEQVPKLRPFITSHSGGANGELYVKVKVKTIDELHQAHDIVMQAFDPDLMRRVAAKAGVDLGGNPLPKSEAINHREPGEFGEGATMASVFNRYEGVRFESVQTGFYREGDTILDPVELMAQDIADALRAADPVSYVAPGKIEAGDTSLVDGHFDLTVVASFLLARGWCKGAIRQVQVGG